LTSVTGYTLTWFTRQQMVTHPSTNRTVPGWQSKWHTGPTP